MQRLIASGLNLFEGDQPFVWRGTLTWSAYGRYLHQGEAVWRGLLRDRKTCGANTICCAGMLTWGYPFSPQTPGYWENLRRFVDIAAEEGMRVCFVVFCDTAALMPHLPTQLAHWERFYVTLGDKDNVTLVLCNQPGHPSQRIDPMRFLKPQPVAGWPALLAARDNPHEDAAPTLPPWDFSAFCGKRNEPHWYIEAGGLSMWTIVNDYTHGPTVLFEPPPCGRRPEWTDQGKWRQFARSHCFHGTVGGNFYSDYDAQSELLTGVVRYCAVEYLGNLPRP